MNSNQAAKVLGVKIGTVSSLVAKGELNAEGHGCMGVPHLFLENDVGRCKKLREMKRKFASINSIKGVALRLGVSPRTVRRHIKVAGLPISGAFFDVVCGRITLDEGTQTLLSGRMKRKLRRSLPRAKNALA